MIDIDKIVGELMAELSLPTALFQQSTTNPCDVAKRLEHSLLVADLTQEKLISECKMARDVQAAAVCVAPNYVADAAKILADGSTVVCAAVGFPSAFMSAAAKAADVRECIMSGAAEIDLAIDISAIKSGDFARAEKDFLSAAEIVLGRAAVKAVFEHGSYNAYEQEKVLLMIERSGVPFVKIQNMTSGHGARCEEIKLVKNILGDKVKIKIDGGVKTLSHALELFNAGASRIGLTATLAIAKESKGGK